MKKTVLTTLGLALITSSVFAADKAAKSAPVKQQEQMQQVQCIPGTLKERQTQARTQFEKNLTEVEKDGAITKEDAAKLKAANDVMVDKVMPFVEKKNPLVFCVNIEADLKAKGIPFEATMPTDQPPAKATKSK